MSVFGRKVPDSFPSHFSHWKNLKSKKRSKIGAIIGTFLGSDVSFCADNAGVATLITLTLLGELHASLDMTS